MAMGKKASNIPKTQRQLNKEEIAMPADAGDSGQWKETFPRTAILEAATRPAQSRALPRHHPM